MIIQRYLYREISYSFAAALSVLLLVYLSNRFVRFLAEAAAGKIPSDVIFQLLALKIIGNLVLFLPFALFLAILMALGRLHRDSEVVALTAGGIGLSRLAQNVLSLALGFGLAAAVLSLYISPRVAEYTEELHNRAEEQSEIIGVFPGRFKELSGSDEVVYVEDISPDRRRMHNVFVQTRQNSELKLLVSASAYQSTGNEDGRYIILENGYRYEGQPGALDYVITRFGRHGIRMSEGPSTSRHKKRETMTTTELLGAGGAADWAELHWRLSHPIAAVLLAMLAVAMSRSSQRQGKYGRLFLAILAYFIYSNLIGVAQKLVERGELAPFIGIWPVHGALALLILGLLFYQSTGRWRLVRRLRSLRTRK